MLRTDGLYLNKKRLYTYQAGKTPGHLKRDGDDGYLVDPLYRALESQPRSHVSIVAARGFTFPSRLLLKVQYTAENVYRAAGKATEPLPHGVSFSVTCGN